MLPGLAPGSRDDGGPDGFHAHLASYEGKPAATGGTGKDPVNEPMIRHWCEAMGDTNPAYPAVAPPAMLQAWTMGGLSGHTDRTRGHDELFALLDGAGYTSIVATDCEQEYLRPLRPGDRITFDAVIESVSPRKTTRLGPGHFVTTRMNIRDGAGRPVGTHRFRILKYAPGAAGGGKHDTAPATRPRPVVNRDNAGFWDGVARHELLIQRCTGCKALRFPWLPGCGDCGSQDWTTVEAAGTGTVHSYVVMHHPPFPAFDPPYAVALAELAEGVRMVCGITGVPYDRVRIGMPVTLDFLRVDDDLELPVFRAADDDVLPPLRIPVTRTLIVAGAIASRDYQDVHHDAEAARERGSPDIFMNILTTNGLVGRYITDHFGPRARLRRIAIRLGAPNYPGDEMVITGTVTSTGSREGDHRPVEIAVLGRNSLGKHVTGTVTVLLPSSEEEATP